MPSKCDRRGFFKTDLGMYLTAQTCSRQFPPMPWLARDMPRLDTIKIATDNFPSSHQNSTSSLTRHQTADGQRDLILRHSVSESINIKYFNTTHNAAPPLRSSRVCCHLLTFRSRRSPRGWAATTSDKDSSCWAILSVPFFHQPFTTKHACVGHALLPRSMQPPP